MEEALAKIRPHTASNLAHQKTPATLLIALESTIKEQQTESSPTAYFAALLTTLDGTIQKKEISVGDGDVLPAELYLLALIAPFVPPPVIRSNLNTLLGLTSPLFPLLAAAAPALRSQLSLYNAIFLCLERAQLESGNMRQTFASILQLCLDQRPRVRKKAAEVVKEILDAAPPPSLYHPYSDRVAEWVKSALEGIIKMPISRPKAGKSESAGAESAIHILTFLRPVLKSLPPSSYADLISLLLNLPRLGNPYLSQSTYSIISDLLTVLESEAAFGSDQIPDILNVIISSPPSKFDNALSSVWVEVLGNAMASYSDIDAEACGKEVGRVWKTVWPFLESTEATTRQAAAHALDAISRCFTASMVSTAGSQGHERSTVAKIVAQTSTALDSAGFAHAIPDVLSVLSSLVVNIPATVNSEASLKLVLPLVKQVGDLRTQKAFEYKENADSALSVAMRTLGPHKLLEILPLNLDPSDREAGREPRAYLLPLLAQPHVSPLPHFVTYFVPLSERMFDLQQQAEMEGRHSEAKVWTVLVSQVWAGLAGYCYSSTGLKEALTPQFSQLLSQLLYGQPELRPSILKALRVLVDSNVEVANADGMQGSETKKSSLSPEQAAKNVTFLRSQVESWLAVFFNVFGSVGRDNRNVVGDVISSWASIAAENDISKAYLKVIGLLQGDLAKPQSGNINPDENITLMTQDLLILLLPYLTPADATALFNICLSQQILCSKDNGVQKRGYKLLTKLVESGKIPIQAESDLQKLDDMVDGLAPAAKKDRFNLLALLIPCIPANSLHLIVTLIPEAVLGTKEPSDKARSAAFDVIIAMGVKMKQGGVVKRNMIDGMDTDDGSQESSATIEEFLTMIAGGLAGASPHMISATVTAMSRLIFEFKDDISHEMQSEILTTQLVFLSSSNREIVKSILGFVKLIIHTLPVDVIRPHLKALVPALLGWSHDHKNHFKVKVRHIFERILRRFSWEEVYEYGGNEEAAKVLTNIKKRKERAKRRKAEKDDHEGDTHVAKPTTGDAFEDVLYGSESELEDSDGDDDMGKQTAKAGKKDKKGGNTARLRMDGDDPIDLLQGTASRITTGNNNRRKPGQDAGKFKTNENTGKMIIDENDLDEDGHPSGHDPAGEAYKESLTSVDGFTRGANGQVKFNKDTKKRRRAEEDEDVEMEDSEATKKKQQKRRVNTKLGHEFKAKKAGGDLKKGGVDPYAYLSLSSAAKKSAGKRHRIGVTNK